MTTLAASAQTAPARRLRISLVTETYPPEINGVAMTVGHLVDGLLGRGHGVQLIRPRQSGERDPRREGDLDIVPLPGIAIPFYRELKLGLPVTGRLLRLWRPTPPDLVHIVTEGPLGASALTAGSRLKLPVTSSFHTNFHSYSRHYRLGLLAEPIVAYLRRFHNRTACTLVPTRELAERLRERGFRHLSVLARGVDTHLFNPARRSPALRERWGVAENDPVFLYVGRLAAEKNLDLAVAAFQAVRQTRASARFVLVGDGPMTSRLRARHPDFVFCGMRLGEQLAAHYASADVFLFPSLTETFGNVLLEAMASGLAVIAFDYAAAHEHLEHDHSGLRAPYRDATAFVEAARVLGGDLERARRLGSRASQAVQRWHWTRIHEQLETLFLDVVEGGRHVPT